MFLIIGGFGSRLRRLTESVRRGIRARLPFFRPHEIERGPIRRDIESQALRALQEAPLTRREFVGREWVYTRLRIPKEEVSVPRDHWITAHVTVIGPDGRSRTFEVRGREGLPFSDEEFDRAMKRRLAEEYEATKEKVPEDVSGYVDEAIKAVTWYITETRPLRR